MAVRLTVGLIVCLVALEAWGIQGDHSDQFERSSKSQSIHALASVAEPALFVRETERVSVKPGIARLAEPPVVRDAVVVQFARQPVADRVGIDRPHAAMQRGGAGQADREQITDRHRGHDRSFDNSRAAMGRNGCGHLGGTGGVCSMCNWGYGARSFVGNPWIGSPYGFGNCYSDGFLAYGGFGWNYFGGDFAPVGYWPTRSVTIMYADPEGRRWDMMMRGINNFAAGKPTHVP